MNAKDLAVCLIPINLKWFTFTQNNSGGKFRVDDNVDAYVIIQAHSPVEANELAQRIGIYFNGVADGYDCKCCGDRWSEAWGEGDDVPEIYGKPVAWSPDVVFTSAQPGDNYRGLRNGVKVYPYDIISKL